MPTELSALPSPAHDSRPLAPPVALERLSGEVCMVCGSREGLRPSRMVYTSDGCGGLYGWPAATCPQH
ncbi:hypothetical protein [Mangrovactinospora gilvigrisea]|uniref:hypothetical protein n=1 Tax=Mangrovactinospora gilvigrisea TaxID=1428644 RepID=UPI001114D2E5|nr:hypothetical protein [Mangrovactinospora gilvigrisea]